MCVHKGQNSKFARVYLLKSKICIWSDPGVNLPICKYTPVCICVRMRHLLTPSKICTPEYIYTRVFFAHANWTLEKLGKIRFTDKSQQNRLPTVHNRTAFQRLLKHLLIK